MKACIYRFPSTDQGTHGIFICRGLILHTLELPDRQNKPNVSCIPNGEYQVTQRYSPSFRKTLYWIKNVPDRSYILVHAANFAGDESKGFQTHLQGCVTLGKASGKAKNKYGNMQGCVFRSAQAVREFEEHMQNKDFTLTIKDL